MVVCLAVTGSCGELSAEPRGFEPRPNRTQYFVTSFTQRFAFAATMVPAGDVIRQFGADVSRRYIVVELGFFSKSGAAYDLRYSDFTLKVHPTGGAVHAANAVEIQQSAGLAAERLMLPEGAATRTGGYLFFPAQLHAGEGCEVEYTGSQSWLSMPVRHWR